MDTLQDAFQRFFLTSPIPPHVLGQSLWFIIALPLLGAFVNGVFGRKLGRANVHIVALAAVGGAFVLSVLAFWATSSMSGGPPVMPNPYGGDPARYAFGFDYGTWFAAGDFRANYGLVVDHLSGMLLLVITGVGFLIHLYSTSYMEHDEGYWRYFAYLNLFVAAMLTLVLADNLVLLFVGWEGVGMASYLLIGFYYTDPAKAWAGRKAFITNRIGDFAFLIGSFLLVLLVGAFQKQADEGNWAHARGSTNNVASRDQFAAGLQQAGPLNFRALHTFASALPQSPTVAKAAVTLESTIAEGPLKDRTFGGVLTVAMLLFLLGAAGKSAQLPLYVWLPDAMAGPTPVSALIHAATMVTAGVYLFCRMSAVLVLSPTAMAVILVVGTLTSLLAALIAFAQDDIKKVLAYSTVSQLGIMFMGVGAGVFWAAAFHLVTHAFFKACLFLGAGSVMHGNGDETDIKKLGGLRKEMRWTWGTFLVATFAITGIVPLSGFFSKDAIFHGVHANVLGGHPWTHWLYYAGLLIALCTAFYMTRLYLLTFEGPRSPEARVAHAHESAWPMTLPLVVLAVLSVVAAIYAYPGMTSVANKTQKEPLLQNYLYPSFHGAENNAFRSLPPEARKLWQHPEGGHAPAVPAYGARLDKTLPGGLDYAKAWVIVMLGGLAAAFLYLRYFPARARAGAPTPAWAMGFRRLAFNKFYVDELYELVVIRPIKVASGLLFRLVDALLIDTVAVRGSAWVTTRVGAALRYVQTGDAQGYAAVMALALVGAAAYGLFHVLR